MSLTQTITPNRLMGRVNASDRFLTWGALPLSSLIGGWLAEQWGPRSTLLLSCGGVFLGILWIWWSPLRTFAFQMVQPVTYQLWQMTRN